MKQMTKSNMAKIFGLTFVLSLLAAWIFATFLGPGRRSGSASGGGFSAGLFWVTVSLGIHYLFERKSLKLFLINGGYHTAQFTVIGLVLALVPCKDAPLSISLRAS